MKTTFLAVLLLVIGVSSLPSYAYEGDYSNMQAVFTAGLTGGGDDLIEVDFSNAPDEEIEAGGLLYFGAGFTYHAVTTPMSFQATLNYHFDAIDSKNGEASFSRLPIDVLLYFNVDPMHRFGFGITRHFSVELEDDFDAPGALGDVDFDDATGWVFEYNYQPTPKIAIGLRYVDIEYEPNTVSGFPVSNVEPADGSHFGILFSFYL